MENFKDKTVIITGGSEGVGAATARKFAAAGANLLLVARSKKNLEAIAAELGSLTDVKIVPMDVTDAGACTDIFKKAEFEFGSVHVLINNAAYHKRGPVEKTGAADLGRMIDVNLKAPIMLSRLAIPYLRKSEGGAAIINIASLAGRAPIPGNATYSASKFGLRIFTFALADELRGSGIKLGVVSPGPIDTGFIMANIDEVADINFSQPISTPEEVADEILSLCLSDKREKAMPFVGGILTSLTYLFPGLRKAIQPVLERRGRKVKRELKAKMAAASREPQP
jgi:short-subunit dehydrogenase